MSRSSLNKEKLELVKQTESEEGELGRKLIELITAGKLSEIRDLLDALTTQNVLSVSLEAPIGSNYSPLEYSMLIIAKKIVFREEKIALESHSDFSDAIASFLMIYDYCQLIFTDREKAALNIEGRIIYSFNSFFNQRHNDVLVDNLHAAGLFLRDIMTHNLKIDATGKVFKIKLGNHEVVSSESDTISLKYSSDILRKKSAISISILNDGSSVRLKKPHAKYVSGYEADDEWQEGDDLRFPDNIDYTTQKLGVTYTKNDTITSLDE